MRRFFIPVFFNVPADRLQDFDAWNEEDHLPLLMDEEKWLGVRRFEIFDGSPARTTALHFIILATEALSIRRHGRAPARRPGGTALLPNLGSRALTCSLTGSATASKPGRRPEDE